MNWNKLYNDRLQDFYEFLKVQRSSQNIYDSCAYMKKMHNEIFYPISLIILSKWHAYLDKLINLMSTIIYFCMNWI